MALCFDLGLVELLLLGLGWYCIRRGKLGFLRKVEVAAGWCAHVFRRRWRAYALVIGLGVGIRAALLPVL